jgi:hypothetical protein
MKIPELCGRKVYAYDMEIYPNWYCLTVTDGEQHMCFDPLTMHTFLGFINKGTILAGYNSFKYDDVLLGELWDLASEDRSLQEAPWLRSLSDMLIADREADREKIFRRVYAKRPWFASIDVFQLLNGKSSLKEQSCRAHVADVREAPYDFMKPLPETKKAHDAVLHYCKIDSANTATLLKQKWELVLLREKLNKQFSLGEGIYRLPEQGIAQNVFVSLYKARNPGETTADMRAAAAKNPDNVAKAWPLTAIISQRVTFGSMPGGELLTLLRKSKAVALNDTRTSWDLDLGAISRVPKKMNQVRLWGVDYQLGVGGLHSIDGPGRWDADQFDGLYSIVDLDVTSYYPSIMITEKLEPKHWDGRFSADMRTLRDQRVAAKKRGDKVVADALKIVINSTFGKLNDAWSPFRSIPDAMRVTVNGQLFLLMLIERLTEFDDVEVLSANTDGVTCRIATSFADRIVKDVTEWFKKVTDMDLEETRYRKYSRRDVNNYVAVTVEGKVKSKGAFCADTGKGDGLVIKKAAVAYLLHGTPVADTVKAAAPTDFIFYQRCRNGGGLYFAGKPIGGLGRWVTAVPMLGEPLRRKNPQGTWATLPNADCVSLCLALSDLDPAVIDRGWYVEQAQALVDSTLTPSHPLLA